MDSNNKLVVLIGPRVQKTSFIIVVYMMRSSRSENCTRVAIIERSNRTGHQRSYIKKDILVISI